ncbi:MAG TPA: peptide chain release factor N(5)-glutamine methyltransferase [Chloroflexota bacterium]|nr:peptide chain release factor N(5)-glutamine methyltransferase [Chloroflexota bacterium]
MALVEHLPATRGSGERAHGSIHEAVLAAASQLAQTSATPRLDAEVLAAHLLAWDRARLLGHWDEPLPVALGSSFRALAARRAVGEPVAYITGHKEFLEWDFLVDPRVLIPRPESELLVQMAVDWLGGRPGARVVDVGTGSGALAICIALKARQARVAGVDISKDALAVARQNAWRLNAVVEWLHGSLLEPLSAPVDLVVANLPYLDRETVASGERALRFEPRLALTDEGDGLSLFRALCEQLPDRLTPDGAVLLEVGDARQAASVAALVRAALPWAIVTCHADLAGLPRVLQACRRA